MQDVYFFLRCVCFNCEIVDTFSHDSYDNHCLFSSGCHMNRGHLTLGQFPFSGPRLKGKLRQAAHQSAYFLCMLPLLFPPNSLSSPSVLQCTSLGTKLKVMRGVSMVAELKRTEKGQKRVSPAFMPVYISQMPNNSFSQSSMFQNVSA